MRIMHVMWSAKYGGAETMLVDILNYQVRQHEVELLIVNDAIEKSLLDCFDRKIKITTIKRPLRSRHLYYVLKLNWKLLFSKADIVHFHQDDLIRYIPIYPLKRNFCLTIHSVEMDVVSLPKYNYRFAVSSVVQEKLKNAYQLDSMLVINGIEINAIAQRKAGYDLKTVFRMVQIGRLAHQVKGQHILLRAIHQLVYEYHFQDFHLDFIGDGLSEEYLKILVNELNLDQYVTFLGVRPKEYVRRNLCQYDLLVQPSILEGFGLAAVEAMAALVPALVSNVDGLKAIAMNGENAFVFEPEDASDCAAKLHQIIHMSSTEKERRCRQSYVYALNHYDVSRTAQDYLNYYQQLVLR